MADPHSNTLHSCFIFKVIVVKIILVVGVRAVCTKWVMVVNQINPHFGEKGIQKIILILGVDIQITLIVERGGKTVFKTLPPPQSSMELLWIALYL